MKKYFVAAALIVLASCGGEDQKVAEVTRDEPLSQSKNSAEFSNRFSEMLNSYYNLKDALVLSNVDQANTTAQNLANRADSLQLGGVNADSTIVELATNYVQSIAAESKGLVGEKDLEAKRRSFEMISGNMYDLLRTVRYDKETVYHQYCPMAFNDEGAFWLSSSSDIKNPYFGKKMLTCGEVKDSLNFQ